MSEKTGTTDLKGWMNRELDDLRRMRDELRLQAHLGKAELRSRWESLERAFERFEDTAKRTSRAAEEPRRHLEQDLRQLAHDLHDGYRRIRDAI